MEWAQEKIGRKETEGIHNTFEVLCYKREEGNEAIFKERYEVKIFLNTEVTVCFYHGGDYIVERELLI